MPLTVRLALSALFMLFSTTSLSAEEILFEDNFDNGLSPKWQLQGLHKDDYRIRDGALEMRVHSKDFGKHTPMLKVMLPFTTDSTVTASVEVTLLNEFTEPKECAELRLIDERGWLFSARKQLIDKNLVYSPGKPIFQGKPGEEGDGNKWTMSYTEVDGNEGPLRIIVNQTYAYFQVGPLKDNKRKYLNFFHSAINDDQRQCGFALLVGGAANGVDHWVRFDNFKVTK